MMVPVAILAGGLATRLRPLTETIPKVLVEVAGEPFVAHQLRLLRRRGIEEVVLCLGHLGEQVEAAIGTGQAFGLRVRYSHDGEKLLGTGGALRQALTLLGDEFFVLYGDSYLLCDYRDVLKAFRASGKQALMTVYRNEGKFDTSNVQFERGEILRYDKKARTESMRHIDYGLGLFRREAFAGVPHGEALDLAKLYQDLLAAGQLAAYEVTERFYEIGSKAGLEDFRQQILSETLEGHR